MRTAILALALAAALAPTALAAKAEHAVFLHDQGSSEFGRLHLTPPVINAKVGDTLVFTIYNQGSTPHNFLVCGDGADFDEACADRWGFTGMIAPNETAQTTVEVTKAGEFDYYCYIAGHKGGGMAGKLMVQGSAEEKSTIPLGPLALAALGAAAVLGMRRRGA